MRIPVVVVLFPDLHKIVVAAVINGCIAEKLVVENMVPAQGSEVIAPVDSRSTIR